VERRLRLSYNTEPKGITISTKQCLYLEEMNSERITHKTFLRQKYPILRFLSLATQRHNCHCSLHFSTRQIYFIITVGHADNIKTYGQFKIKKGQNYPCKRPGGGGSAPPPVQFINSSSNHTEAIVQVNYRPVLSSERALQNYKNATVWKKFQGESKIGRGSQMGAWHQDWLADWLSVVMWLRLRHSILHGIKLPARFVSFLWSPVRTVAPSCLYGIEFWLTVRDEWSQGHNTDTLLQKPS
jgi:hypothetical protein